MTEDEDQRLRSVALQNASEVLAARERADERLARARDALEIKTRELAKSLAMMRATLEATADGILVTNDAGVITHVNEKYVQIWGFDRAAVDGRSHAEVCGIISRQFGDPSAFLARVQEIYASSEDEVLDVLTLADGRVFERLSRVQEAQHGEGGRVWSFRDVTERVNARRQLETLNKRLEQKVAERTAKLRWAEQEFEQLVMGVADVAIYMLDPQGHIVSWNPGAERIKGYTAGEIIGRSFSTFYTAEDRASGVPERALRTAAREGKYESEAWRVRKDGTRFWASVLIDAIRTADGTLMGFAKVTRDMTERRAMQEQLHQSQKMEAIGQLTGGVAHDFNNLLTVIIGNLETIWRHTPVEDTRLRRAVDQATRGAQRAATLTQQLLAFSRRQPLNPKPIDANRLVTGMSDLMRRTLHESIALETVLGGGLWRVEVDAHQLESALLNLAVNARDAMPQGGKLTIETANAHLDEAYASRFADVRPGQYVVICVSDTGEGMTSEVLAHAFDPFFTTKPIGQGTGLGLSQVFGFVKQSGGHVRLYSEVGEGTTVKIYLPRMTGDAVVHEPEPITAIPRGDESETILVVEDDDDVRIYSTETLRELGFSVLEAHDGASALQMLEHHPEVDLLFTDVGLPGLNGRQLVDEVHRRRPDVRVLFTSGYARNAIVHQGRLDPGVELLTKPFTRGQLGARVRDALDARKGLRASRRTVLVIEDEPLVRMYMVDTLEELGFAVVQAAGAAEGREAAQRLANIEAIFIDIGLPDGNGLELATEFRKRWPERRIVIASGYSKQARGRLRDDARVAFLQKPFDEASLRAALKAIGVD